ncbi:hypothetical protein NOK96_24455 [Vibrio parahaemolyticus]|uniref:hypothetical protein n=1 Tax=Vibrio parahaemolyticus TaxID=670 RepID=UPI00226B02AC|nr:hypothetical protein [Vibrio parahaemolyticus]MCX8774030.1 hypothetical protein [Vibrio parahaemolyticus]
MKKFSIESAYVIVGLLVIYLVMYSLGHIDFLVPFLFFVALTVTAVLTGLHVYYALSPKSLLADVSAELEKGEAGEFYTISLPITILVFFSSTSFLGWRYCGDSFMLVETNGPLEWLLYGVDNFFRAVFFDAAEIYGLDLSKIEHSGGVIPSTFVFLFRAAISLSVISVAYRAFGGLRMKGYKKS